MARSSAALSDARALMWSTTVPLIRRDSSCGALWHRLQFCWNFCSPTSLFSGGLTAIVFAGGATALVADAFGVCAAESKQHPKVPIAIKLCSLIFSLAMLERGTGR